MNIFKKEENKKHVLDIKSKFLKQNFNPFLSFIKYCSSSNEIYFRMKVIGIWQWQSVIQYIHNGLLNI